MKRSVNLCNGKRILLAVTAVLFMVLAFKGIIIEATRRDIWNGMAYSLQVVPAFSISAGLLAAALFGNKIDIAFNKAISLIIVLCMLVSIYSVHSIFNNNLYTRLDLFIAVLSITGVSVSMLSLIAGRRLNKRSNYVGIWAVSAVTSLTIIIMGSNHYGGSLLGFYSQWNINYLLQRIGRFLAEYFVFVFALGGILFICSILIEVINKSLLFIYKNLQSIKAEGFNIKRRNGTCSSRLLLHVWSITIIVNTALYLIKRRLGYILIYENLYRYIAYAVVSLSFIVLYRYTKNRYKEYKLKIFIVTVVILSLTSIHTIDQVFQGIIAKPTARYIHSSPTGKNKILIEKKSSITNGLVSAYQLKHRIFKLKNTEVTANFSNPINNEGYLILWNGNDKAEITIYSGEEEKFLNLLFR
jgi:hypothetical protein